MSAIGTRARRRFEPTRVTPDPAGARIEIELALEGWERTPAPADFRLERVDGRPSTLRIGNVRSPRGGPGGNNPLCWITVTSAQGHDGAVARYRLASRQAGGGEVTFFAGEVDRRDDPRPPAAPVEPAPAPAIAEIDYLARDYDSLLVQLRDRLARILPDWTEDSPADLMNVLLETFAYVGDYLSYYQDAVSTEAYLTTARRRLSLRRHARLVDYLISEGSNARTWVDFTVSSPRTIPAGTALLTRRDQPDDPSLWFATMWPLEARPAHNALALWTPDVESWSLPRGATSMELVGTPALAVGKVLLLEQVRSPLTGLPEADPTRRHPVRIVEIVRVLEPGRVRTRVRWELDDALPWPLPVRARVAGRSVGRLSVARGNITLADHGRWLLDEIISPSLPPVPSTGRFRPRIRVGPITRLDRFTSDEASGESASAVRQQVPRYAFPQIELWDPELREAWRPRWDLIGSGPDGRDFVVEVDDDGVFLRFGDGENGARPRPGVRFEVRCRVGNGPVGNIGADAIDRLARPLVGVTAVRNPVRAIGGSRPQPMAEIRRMAAENAQRQRRCVVPADYRRRVIDDVAGIDDAVVALEQVGAGQLISVYVSRADGLQVDPHAIRRAQALLDGYRMTDHLMEVRGPIHVPVAIHLRITPQAGALRNAVYQAVDVRLGSKGEPVDAFFHPANFRFGQPLYLSEVIAAVAAVPGVEIVEVTRFARQALVGTEADDRTTAELLEHGVIEVAPHEMIAGGAKVTLRIEEPLS